MAADFGRAFEVGLTIVPSRPVISGCLFGPFRTFARRFDGTVIPGVVYRAQMASLTRIVNDESLKSTHYRPLSVVFHSPYLREQRTKP